MDPRIPLKIVNGLIHTVALVRIPRFRVCGINKFFVDTGSPESFIGQQDANRLHIPVNRLNFTKPALMGGTKISLARIKDVALHLQTKDKAIKIKSPLFHVAKGAWTKKGVVHSNPSILGTDFLLVNNLQLIFWPSNEVAFLRMPQGKP
jgi:hypothetical protein